MLPESELTPTQIAARREIETLYDHQTEQYYKDRLIMIGVWEEHIRDQSDKLSAEDLEKTKQAQQNFIKQCGELGINVDLDSLYEAQKQYLSAHTQSQAGDALP